jgi:hypothetical protein
MQMSELGFAGFGDLHDSLYLAVPFLVIKKLMLVFSILNSRNNQSEIRDNLRSP